MVLIALVTLLFAFAGVVALAWLVASRLGVFATPGRLTLPVALAVVVVVSLVVVGAFARAFGRVRKPLQAVMEAADKVAAGDYSTQVAELGPPPIRSLVRSFNTMTQRLHDNDRVRRDLMADIAHELRTPLTIMRGRLEGLADGVYAWDGDQLHRLQEEAETLSRLIDDLRTLALSESGALRLEIEPTDLGLLSHDLEQAFAVDASERGVTLNVEVAGAFEPVNVDPVRMREVIANLLSNALRHTPCGGSVTLRVDRGPRGDVRLEVHDTGRGMNAEELARVFDRFHKGAESRGSGLGLTIARSLVTAHGGELHATSEPGNGTVFAVTLPTGPASP